MRRRTFLRAAGSLPAAATVGTAAAATGGGTPAESPSPANVSLTGATEAVVADDGTTVYVATHDGFGVVDVSDFENPTVLAERRNLLAEREYGPLTGIYDVSASGDRLLVAGPRTALLGETLGGFLLYDVSDPSDPERVAFFETDHGIHNAYLDGDAAYLTGTGAVEEPLVVVDVADDEPEEIARWSIADENADWRSVQDSVHTCHDVYVQDDTAYVAYWDGGTWLLDVSDPADPAVELHVGGRDPEEIAESDVRSLMETTELPGNSHYAAPNEDGTLLAVGREAWDYDETDRIGGPGGITLWDIGDRSAPERLVRLAPPTFDRESYVNRTSHNFGFRGDRLYTSWYAGGVRVYDVSAPAEPTLVGSWSEPDETSFWTAQPANGGFVAASRFAPSKREELSREAQREPSESAKLFAFPEPSGEDARPARTGPPATTATRTADTTTTATDARTTAAEATTTEAPRTTPEADTPGFGVGATVIGGGLALARLLRKRS